MASYVRHGQTWIDFPPGHLLFCARPAGAGTWGGKFTKISSRVVALSLAVALSSSAFAQQPLVVGAAATGHFLEAGTVVPLKTRYELTTEGKRLKAGDRFDMEVVDAVVLDGHVVIPAGARAVGEVTAVRNKGMWGKSGNIDARPLYVIVGERQLRLGGDVNDKGKAGGAGAVAVSALVFLPAGFFMTGTSARIPAGTQVMARLEEKLEVAFADMPPATAGGAPMLVATAAPK
jgi:hypothetical protein